MAGLGEQIKAGAEHVEEKIGEAAQKAKQGAKVGTEKTEEKARDLGAKTQEKLK